MKNITKILEIIKSVIDEKIQYIVSYQSNDLVIYQIQMPTLEILNKFDNDQDIVVCDSSFRALNIQERVDLPSAKIIENNAFESSKIDTLNLQNVETVGSSSFRCLKTKTKLDLSNVTVVPERCFESSKLNELKIRTLKSISVASFRWFRPQVKSTIKLSKSITTIPRQCFEYAMNVDLFIFGNITEIEPFAFKGFKGQIFTSNKDIFINAGVSSDQVNHLEEGQIELIFKDKVDEDLLFGKTIVFNNQGDTISGKMLCKIKSLFDSANNHENILNEMESTQLKNK